MRLVSCLVISVGLLTALGCSRGGKDPIRAATPEEIQQQKDAEKEVQAAESQMRKNQPKDKTPQQSVEDQERARQKR
jgi:hypothetical protein